MKLLRSRLSGTVAALGLTTWLAAGLAMPCAGAATTWTIEPGGGRFAKALASATPGDKLKLRAGIHQGPVIISKPVELRGEPGAILDGGGASRTITVDAPDVTIRGIEVRGSGKLLETEDSGIFVTESGDRALIAGNKLIGNLIGIYLKGPTDAWVIGNRIQGRKDLRLNERGNGIHLWNTPGSIIEGNEITDGRDGVFVTTSKRNVFRRNSFRNVRFGVHYMYTNDSEVSGNLSQGNHLGYAIMYSSRIRMTGNRSEGDRDRGILLNYTNRSEFSGNSVKGAKKCVFIYNANRNQFRENTFEGCGIGIHFTAGSEHNVISGNAFLANRTQVKYVGSRHVEWSEKGRGNYWSDNLAFDLNGDGRSDRPYKPNDIADQLIWRHPAAKLLLTSPAMQVLRLSQSALPALFPGGVTDSAPLMLPSATLTSEEQ
jgi:nitrous oxidase accessory protein